jgi:hypothetical protein
MNYIKVSPKVSPRLTLKKNINLKKEENTDFIVFQ